jgi:glutamate-1-semialdehyde 2,1-aminomutase
MDGMEMNALVMAAAGGAALATPWARARVALSRAKHPSLAGHARIARRVARLLPYYEHTGDRFFDVDGAPADVVRRRRDGFARLAARFAERAPRTLAASAALKDGLSDLRFTDAYRVPFPFSRHLAAHLPTGVCVGAASNTTVTDLDGNAAFDLAGSYGLNVFGYDFYRQCIDAGVASVRDLGPVLGSYHPVVEANVARLRAISGLDEVSFHMSGTEAVMQAVRLARYHTGRSHHVQFTGAYHGWWDGVQPGVGNPRRPRDVYTLREMDERTLRVLESRRDVACVLVNPLQALHPNGSAPGDAALIGARRVGAVDRAAYVAWLARLRDVCTRRDIPLIFDEVFVGFRLARGGAQEYFGVKADLVTYGKTLGGGLPVGVLCGTRRLMKRFRDERPSDVCFARGTFNSHPYVMGAMDAFLERVDEPARRASYDTLDAVWAGRAAAMNAALAAHELPVRVAALTSIWTVCYDLSSRYNWMLQFYLRAEGLALSWVGTGRLIFSHVVTDADFAEIVERVVAAALAMREDGWWWTNPAAPGGARRQLLRELVAAVWAGSIHSPRRI